MASQVYRQQWVVEISSFHEFTCQLGLPISFMDFHKFDGLTGIGDICYGFVIQDTAVDKWNTNNISSVQNKSEDQILRICYCAQSAVSTSHRIQLIYPSFNGTYLLSMHNKPADVDNHTGLFAILQIYVTSLICVHLWHSVHRLLLRMMFYWCCHRNHFYSSQDGQGAKYRKEGKMTTLTLM